MLVLPVCAGRQPQLPSCVSGLRRSRGDGTVRGAVTDEQRRNGAGGDVVFLLMTGSVALWAHVLTELQVRFRFSGSANTSNPTLPAPRLEWVSVSQIPFPLFATLFFLHRPLMSQAPAIGTYILSMNCLNVFQYCTITLLQSVSLETSQMYYHCYYRHPRDVRCLYCLFVKWAGYFVNLYPLQSTIIIHCLVLS